jgi:predicted peptidase
MVIVPITILCIAVAAALCIHPASSFIVKARAPSRYGRLLAINDSIKDRFDNITLKWWTRRKLLATVLVPLIPLSSHAESPPPLRVISDQNTYSGLVYVPPSDTTTTAATIPLIVFLHGAGKNERDVWNLADITGEHAGLLPSLIASNQAPEELTDNFAVLMPYSQNKPSFYDEPRSKLLAFIDWAVEYELPKHVDPKRIYLFGFSDGATLGIELMTTRRFAGAVICSYGFTGILPKLALQRLSNLPMWIFHSQDDAIFQVKCSDQLVESLKQVNTNPGIIRYTRFDVDPEGFNGAVRGHTTGITASKAPQVYRWLISLK